jgi:hypothetical protein
MYDDTDLVQDRDSETDLRLAIGDIESRRVSVGDAYRSIHLGLGLILFQIGQARVLWTMIAILVAYIGLAWLTMSVLVVLAGLLVLGLTALYVEAKIEDWVADYNDRLDSEIRRLLADAADEDS